MTTVLTQTESTVSTDSTESKVLYEGRIVSCTQIRYYPIRKSMEDQYGLHSKDWAPYGFRVALERFCPGGDSDSEWFPCSERDESRLYSNTLVEIYLPVKRDGNWLNLLVPGLDPDRLDVRSQLCRIILEAPDTEPTPQTLSGQPDQYRRFCGRVQHDLPEPYRIVEVKTASWLDLEAERLYREFEAIDTVTNRLIQETI